jgi:drug/metabolite transporter (DMT)-like permease
MILAAVFSSTSGLLIKLIDWNPLAIAGSRSIVAALVLVLTLSMRGRLRFTFSKPQLGGAAAYAFMVIFFVSAVKLTTAANAALLQYTAPVFTAVLGFWFLKEKVFSFDWAIVLVVMGGMSLFFLDKLAPGGAWGNILAVFSGIMLSVFTLFMRKQKDGSPIETVILGNIATVLVGIPFYFQGKPSTLGWAVIVIVGVFQLGLPFLLYSEAIKHITALDAVLYQAIEPLLNPIWVLLVIGEAPGPWAVAGGMVVLGAVTCRSIYRNRKDPPGVLVKQV